VPTVSWPGWPLRATNVDFRVVPSREESDLLLSTLTLFLRDGGFVMHGHELAMALRAAYLALHRPTDALMAEFGVTAEQFVVLAALAEGDAVTQRDLVSRTSSDPNTLRAMLVLLERRRLIERRPHPTDGRARSVSLTQKGRSVFHKLWQQSEPLRRRLEAALSTDDAELLIAQLRGIATAMVTEQADSSKARHHPAVSKRH
jgi:DNA-binding MarR family transcriptional regulator